MTNGALGPAYNFRDLGGLPTEDGRITRHGVLYRSATLHDCGPADAAVLRDRLGIGSVIDLRTHDEIAAQGAASAAAWGARCLSLPVLPPPLPAHGGPADLLSRYLAYLEHSTPNVIAALRHVSEELPRPVAIHCTSGKDRTGVVVSLLLRLVGVTRDAVVRDYAATTGNVSSVMERLGRTGPRPLKAGDIPPGILEAEEQTLSGFLAMLESRYGGVRAWALGHGLERGAIAALEAALIEGRAASG
ncbi:MAG TPA: tyrosine-protein phosphatase [Acidimicrobiia bacterium]|nr:tyrosine-protein phosphatase [Acidimicrobiia bacterium]